MYEKSYKQIPVKSGKLIKNTENNFLLISNSGKAYSTNIVITEIWKLCNGENSTEAIINSIHLQFSKMKKSEIMSLLEKLLNTELIELL
ncbi:PqqD family peptide modification chaperone [Bacteriovorax sp. Seq25_V]|uniref:PqqD family peptide modification chaperone n=1 Tax=Bacteriovorax sp. Seq25_V TaxID=1201288 RepID=UPI00038A43BC|nr:PqqD family peptide modification chaperone [Bacteriovorax sp. Seq25_V]EQC47206.1 hypothetical protein M900_1032 [Bacteriovorax sp. Seq25_V]